MRTDGGRRRGAALVAAVLAGLAAGWMGGRATSLPAAAAAAPAYRAAARAAPDNFVVDAADDGVSAWWTAVADGGTLARAYPRRRVEIVAHAGGIHMLLSQSPVAAAVSALPANVEVAACATAMAAYGIRASQLVRRAVVVPSGVVEIARREVEGYLYLNAS